LRVPETVAPQALAIAERLGDTERASEACTLALAGLAYYSAGAIFTSPEWAMWTEKLDGYAEPESASRVRADAMMSWTYAGRHQQQECWQLRSQALVLARRVDDPAALSYAVLAFMGGNVPPQLAAEQLRVAEEFATLGHAIPRPGPKAQFFAVCGTLLLGGGKREMAESLWQELDEYAARIGDPYVRMWQMSAQALRHSLDGQLEQAVDLAEQFGNQAAALGVEVVGQMISAMAATGPMVDLGRFEEALALQPRFDFSIGGAARHARLFALAGRREEARQEVRRIMAARAIGADEDWTDMGTLVQLLEAAVMVKETHAAAVLSSRLAGLDEWYMFETRSSVARLRAQAALLLGNAEEARGLLTTALEVAQRVRARGESALVRWHLAELLLKHYPEERADALAHLDFVIPEFRDMKMQPSLERALRHKMKVQGISGVDIKTSIDAVTLAVERERPDVSVHAAPNGKVTLMFSDIEGSTPLAERLGDEAWVALLREHNAIFREQITRHDGHEVKTMGDAFMVAFRSAEDAVRCAVSVQGAFATYNREHGEQPLLVRIGLHTGEAVRDAGDFYGTNVILASRLVNEAQGGQILASADLRDLTDGGEFAFGEGRDVALKGISGAQRVFEVRWREEP
jgi:class 3 adenylate cyclase